MFGKFARLFLLGSLAFPLLAQATSHAIAKSSCSALGRTILGVVHASRDEMRAVSCREVRGGAVMLVAVAHAPASDAMQNSDKLPVHVALIGIKHKSVRAIGQVFIAEDSAEEIDESSLRWDETTIELAAGRPGYVLQITPAYHASGAGESGRSASMTLFLAVGSSMKPVLRDLVLSSWAQTCERPPCTHDEVTTRVFNTTYSLAPTSSHGLRDIVLTTTADEDASAIERRVLRFDGARYVVPD